MTIATQSEFDALVSQLTDAATAYYDSAALRMSDADYDAGIELVARTLTTHTEWGNDATEGLLTQVAGGQSAGGDVVHPSRMLSMEKATGLESVGALAAKCPGGVVVEPKMDGLAIRVEYVAGTLTLAATRGDGSAGENVTAQAVRASGVSGLPRQLTSPWTGEVRGEVFMTVTDFDLAQELRAERAGKAFANPRNAVAGSLRKVGEDHWMPMTFAAYDLTDDQPRHDHRMRFAEKLGFTTAQGLLAAHGVPNTLVRAIADGQTAEEVYAEAQDRIVAIEHARPHLPFDIDGAVVKANHDTDRARLGEGSRTPKWAVAFKYQAEEATSVIEDIEVSVGRTGRLGLRARITPTFVGGATVAYATCHNAPWLVSEGIGIGSTVVLKRAGDVIPRITAPLDTDANAHVPTWEPPQACPQCGEPWNKDSLLWRCETPSCGLVSAIEYWSSRDALDVEHLGGVVAEALVEHGTVASIVDLYFLSEEQWATLPTGETSTGKERALGAVTARKLMASLEASKGQPFHRVLTGLGIRGTGRSMSRSLATAFGSMDALRVAGVDQLADVDKIGPKKAQMLRDWFDNPTNVALLDRLQLAGLTLEAEQVAAGGPLDAKTVVISGSVPGYSRTTAQEAVVAAGGQTSSSVSAKTHYLVTEESTTAKAKKAQTLKAQGVDIKRIHPDNFAALLAGQVIEETD